MPISPSSINQCKFEDGPELRDLFITVDDPESHITAIETFITYRVVTKTTRGEFDSSEYEVRRRYQDFLWLKSKLEEAHPTLIIPVCLLKLKLFLFVCKMAPVLYRDV